MLTIVLHKWRAPGYHTVFDGSHVNTMARMIARYYRKPHRIILYTDDASGVDSSITCRPLPTLYGHLPNPIRDTLPSCYRRLWLFRRDVASEVGERILSIDLDAVIVQDVTALWDRPEDFVIWRDPSPRQPYNGGMYLLTAGARPDVWERFEPDRSPAMTTLAGFRGSDQAWIAYATGPHEAVWTQADGVWSYSSHMVRKYQTYLCGRERIVMFHGRINPWDFPAPWVRQHYR